MKNRMTVSLLALLAFSALNGNGANRVSEPENAATGPNLWQKAVEVYRRNRDWYPQKITILSAVLNRRNQTTSVTQFFFSMRMNADGRARTRLERALKNGADMTEKMRSRVTIRNPREEMAPADENTYSVSISASPFNPRQQREVSFTASEEVQVLFGHSCRRFDFTFGTDIVNKGVAKKLTWTGMAWLEQGSGVPVKLEFSLAPLPGKIRSLWVVYNYETKRPDHWVVKNVTLSGHGGFLFIRKNFRVSTTFSDYRHAPGKNGSP